MADTYEVIIHLSDRSTISENMGADAAERLHPVIVQALQEGGVFEIGKLPGETDVINGKYVTAVEFKEA